MSVRRYDLNRCIGCGNCFKVCPMDVFRFDYENMKSVIAYPENCQNCGQCYMNCPGYSLILSFDSFGYTMSANRGPSTLPKQQDPYFPVGDEVIENFTPGGEVKTENFDEALAANMAREANMALETETEE